MKKRLSSTLFKLMIVVGCLSAFAAPAVVIASSTCQGDPCPCVIAEVEVEPNVWEEWCASPDQCYCTATYCDCDYWPNDDCYDCI